MTDTQIVKTYSDHALNAMIRELSRTGQWPDRLIAAVVERDRRNKIRRQKTKP